MIILIMRRRITFKDSNKETSILKELTPLITTGMLVTGVVIWAFNTFAQVSWVKEQNNLLMNTIEQRHKEAIERSDLNRDRVLSVLGEVKETVKTIETRTWSETKGKK